MKLIKAIWEILYLTVQEFIEDRAFQLGAALAFFTLFSLPPLLIVVIALVGNFLGRETVQQQLLHYAQEHLGKEGIAGVQTILNNVQIPDATQSTTWLSMLVLFISAAGLFLQLQDALNIVWGIQVKAKRPFLKLLLDRLFSFMMILAMGGLLLLGFFLDAALTIFSDFIGHYLTGYIYLALFQSLSSLISFALMILLVGFIYKVLPDAKISWRTVIFGAVITSALFSLGKIVISFYLNHIPITPAYGTAGTMLAFLFWLFLSSQIFLLGAEFTEVCTRKYGVEILPADYATWREGEEEKRAATKREKILE